MASEFVNEESNIFGQKDLITVSYLANKSAGSVLLEEEWDEESDLDVYVFEIPEYSNDDLSSARLLSSRLLSSQVISFDLLLVCGIVTD
jgi:hypothetical protein